MPHHWSCLPTSVWRPPVTTRRVGGRLQSVGVAAVQLRTPYESASFDDWELRAEIEEEMKRKQAKMQHEARRAGGETQRHHHAQRFYAAEHAAYRERKTREDAFARYLDTVAVCCCWATRVLLQDGVSSTTSPTMHRQQQDRAKRSARAATDPPKRTSRNTTVDPQLHSEAEAAYHLLAAKTNRFSQYVSALERRKQHDTTTDRRGRRMPQTVWQSFSMDEGLFGGAPTDPAVQHQPGGGAQKGAPGGATLPAWRRGTDIMFDPKKSGGSFDDDFVWADEV